MLKNISKYYVLLVILIIAYIIATYSAPINNETLLKYNLSIFQLRLLLMSIILPYIVIWLIAFYGFIRFKQYTRLIKNTPDGEALHELANGHMILAFSLPATAIIASLLNSYVAVRSPDLQPAAVVINNYLSLGMTLVSFALIARGAKKLTQTIKKKPDSSRRQIITIGFLVLAVLYIYIIFKNPARQVAVAPAERAAYYLPDSLIFLTIIIPYLYVWYLGIRSAMYIDFYKHNVQGQLYKQFLSSLAAGISWVIISSIMLQFLIALNTALARFGLLAILCLLYAVLGLISIGYVRVALGAKRLKKIEEV